MSQLAIPRPRVVSLVAAVLSLSLMAPASSFAAEPQSKGAPRKTAAKKTTKKKAAPKATGKAPAKVNTIAKDPYLGAVVVDGTTGKVLFDDKADEKGYPASILKLMDLLIILEKIEKRELKLTDPVTVTAESSKIGGSQVYLKEKEVFPVEELLCALMVQSANDAAVALAIHVAGSREAFVDLMNKRAKEIGMKSTVFRSVHGLPPARGQEPDVTTARDMALLCVELLKHPEALKYTSIRERSFRQDAPQPFVMRTHNPLLGSFEGCDGLKTGYYTVAGFSIAATAKRNGKRVVAIVLGSTTKKIRDAKIKELLVKGFSGEGVSGKSVAGSGAGQPAGSGSPTTPDKEKPAASTAKPVEKPTAR